ncbi:MAG TPA: carboxypeptidase-like regulatory domain-containing protein, partial [Flavobacteriales bacterium]|nr:carboxypeptidase-like regulatory domain-containing protein [Flavobacteriales bacterium]
MRCAFLLLLVPTPAFAQSIVEGRSVDAETHAPLPYCSVVVQGTTQGTITNADGFFRLAADSLRDTLVFSYVGYARRALPAGALAGGGDVLLDPSVTHMREVEVRANDDRLYQLVARCAQGLRMYAAHPAKLYFEMSTHMDERPVEVLEAFYNVRINGPHVEDLMLKQGRIGIAPVDGRYFVSLDVTKAMSLLDIREAHPKFPMSPFQWTKARALARHYEARYAGSSMDDARLDHVVLEPRDSTSGAFAVEAWIDGTTAQARSIELHCTDCRPHPFVVLKPEDRITSMSMRVRFTFKDGPAPAPLDHMELDYELGYVDAQGPRHVHTTAVMRPFQHNASFILPLFNYDLTQNDYRKITFQPYDSVFWATSPTLVRTDAQEHD